MLTYKLLVKTKYRKYNSAYNNICNIIMFIHKFAISDCSEMDVFCFWYRDFNLLETGDDISIVIHSWRTT